MSRLQYGIEVECVFSISESELRKRLKSVFGFEVRSSSIYGGHASTKSINLYKDYSVQCKRDDWTTIAKIKGIERKNVDLEAIELVFPIVSESKLLRIFDLLEKEFFKPGILIMNSSCGLHVNTSFVSDRIHKRVDIARLAVAFDTVKWKKMFNRSNCMYCRDLITKTDIEQSYRRADGEARIMLMHLHLRLKRKEDKYKAINTSNFDWENGGRIEFRVAGGEKAMKASLMKKHVMAINEAMHEALKKDSSKTTRRLNKLLAA